MLAASDAGRHALLVADTGAGKTLAGFLPTLAAFCPSRGAAARRRPAHALRLAAQGAGARRAAQPRHPGRGDRPADPDRDPQRRHAVGPQEAPARPPAARAADHAREPVAAAQLSRQLRAVRRAQARGDRRGPRLRHRQARRPAGARAGPAAGDRAGHAARRAVGHGRRSRGLPRLAGAVGRDRCGRAGRRREGRPARGRDPAARGSERAVGRARGDLGDPAALRADQAQPHHADLHQHPLPRRVHLPGAVGRQRRQPADRRSTTARCRRRRGARSKGRWRAASCARWSPPPASISGSTGATSTAWCRWARPRARSRLLQRIGRANHRLDQPSRAMLVPGNRFEFLEAKAAKDAVDEGQRDGEDFRPGGLDVLAQHVMACACAGAVRRGRRCWPKCARASPMPGSTRRCGSAC